MTLLLFNAAAAYAGDYEVEVIIFERFDVSDLKLEVWDFSPDKIKERQSRLLALAAKSTPMEFDSMLIHLAEVENSLREANFEILQSARWTQPAAVFDQAPIVSLGTEQTKLPYALVKVYKTALIYAHISLQFSPTGLIDSPHGQTSPDYDSFSFNINNLTLATVDNQTYPDTPATSPTPHYFISEKRRVKYNEIHYFDHPGFGAIVGVWPAESSQ